MSGFVRMSVESIRLFGLSLLCSHYQSEEKWYDIQDLIVESVMPPEVVLSEAFIQIYELQV